jgi:hypothetical protein
VLIELLVMPDCPHQGPALAALQEAGTLAGLAAVPVTVSVIDSTEQARRRGFPGSPTFLIEGVDPFPVAGAPAGLTCRLYATADGLAGVPEVAALQQALREALLRA